MPRLLWLKKPTKKTKIPAKYRDPAMKGYQLIQTPLPTPPPPGDMSHLPFTNLALSQFTGVHMMRERRRRLGIRLMPPADLN
jgi:hypothetical protein